MPTLIISNNTTGGGVGLVHEASMYSAAPNSNFGPDTPLEVGDNTINRAIIKAVGMPALLPPGNTINSITLDLYRETVAGTSTSVRLYKCLRAWNEGIDGLDSPEADAVCWNAAKYLNVNWTTPGALDATDQNATASTSTGSLSGPAQYINFPTSSQFVADAQSWVDAGVEWDGWLMDLDVGGITRRYTAHNGADGQRPIFTIDYTAASASIPIFFVSV